jgi:hypothetical protein
VAESAAERIVPSLAVLLAQLPHGSRPEPTARPGAADESLASAALGVERIMNYSIDWDGPSERDMERHAATIDTAMAEITRLRSALGGIVLVCGSTGNALDDFEEQAEAFYRETGYMRPGKDMPAAGSDERANHEMRWERYAAWVQSKIQAGRAALKPSDGDDG